MQFCIESKKNINSKFLFFYITFRVIKQYSKIQ